MTNEDPIDRRDRGVEAAIAVGLAALESAPAMTENPRDLIERWRHEMERLRRLRADIAANRPITRTDREWLERIDAAVNFFLRRPHLPEPPE